MKSITIQEFKLDTEKYLNLTYLEREDIIIKHKGRTYKVQPLTPPCQFTIDELKEEVMKSTEDAKAGRGYTMEEIRLLLNINGFEIDKQKLLEKIDSSQLIEMIHIFIHELEIHDQKPESLFKDKERIESLLEKKRSFKEK